MLQDHRAQRRGRRWCARPRNDSDASALPDAECVAIGISHTGSTIDTVDALRAAHDSGARTIAITNFVPSPLAGCADLVLTTAVLEATFRSGAMASRIAQLAVIVRSYDRTITALNRTYRAVRSRRIPGDRDAII